MYDKLFKSHPRGTPFPSFLQENEARMNRWALLTEGIEDEYKDRIESPALLRIGLEMLYENYVAMELPTIIRVPAYKLENMTVEQIQEALDSSAVATFDKVSLGLFRRVYPELFMDSLVGIQPTSIPDPRVFYIDHTYGTTVVGGATSGDRLDQMTQHDAYYAGARKYLEAVGTGTGGAVNFDLDRAGTQSHLVYLDGVLQASTAFTIGVGAGGGGVDRIQFVAPPGLGVVITCTYANQLEGDAARDINFTMSSMVTYCDSIKLRSQLTVETEQNMRAYHGESADGELTKALGDELKRELDTAILLDILNRQGAGNVNWQSAGFLPGDVTTTDRTSYNKTLYEALLSADNLVYNAKTVSTTWMVCGSTFAQRLMKLENFNIIPGANASKYNINQRVPLGTLSNRWQVYKCNRMPADQCLLGYKGDSPFHTGYVWAPFVLMYMTPLLDDPNITFKQSRGIMSRGARAMIDANMYATVTVI